MKRSTTALARLLASLTRQAQRRGLNDSQWAAAAGLPKETLSRLRRRSNCDFSTLSTLASAIGAQLAVVDGPPLTTTPDGHFPARVDRACEERLLTLVSTGNLDLTAWRTAGPDFFMAGLAVMLASVGGSDRQALLSLAEALHPGSTHPDVFQMWLALSPIRPSRFIPMIRPEQRRAA